MKQSLFIAHRGAWSTGRRENTIGAIERAAKSGRFAYIEIDVRRTRSDDSATQTPVVLHDYTLDRLYDLYKIPKSKRHRLGQPIHKLTLDIIRGEEIEVSTLAEIMRAADGHPLNIEIKHIEALDSTLEVINDMLSKYSDWSPEKIVISSFDWNILYEVKKRDPRLGLALIYSFRNLPSSFGRHYHTLGARWIMFNSRLAPVFGLLSKSFGIPNRYAYTVNSKLQMRFLKLFGINGFATDSITLPDNIEDEPKD